ncbi:MAG: substrate-binding domain-containing protein [Spirochaetaceae bacterium]
MKKLSLFLILAVLLGTALFAGGQGEQAEGGDDEYEIVMIVKLEGVAWFDNMRLGIQAFNEEFDDVDAFQTGADTADPAAQVALVEDQIARGVDAILVVPNDPASLVPAFTRANAQGIITLTHEASVQQQVSYDVEAFDNIAYGRHMAEVMAEWMDGEGVWQPFVGHLTSTTHNEWVDGEVELISEEYPDITQATDRIEEQENQQIAYERTLELLRSYPDLKAVMGSAMSTVPGAARAIEEMDMIGEVAAFGTCLPSVAGDYIESGAAVSIHFWVPADAGYVTAHAAYMTLEGMEVTDGTDMGRPGYESVTVRPNDSGVPVIYGQAWVDVNADNLDDWRDANGDYTL